MFSHVIAGAPPVSVAPAPTNVTSVTKDAGATVSWQHNGLSVTSYTITPYIGGSPQTPTTIAAGSVTSLTGSNGGTFLQTPVTGLTNATAYTFTVKANTSGGSSPESAQSGANTPLAGLVFGDDFNGAAGSQIDPEWWVYSRCGYIAQSEIEWYLPGQCVLDGSSNLALTGTHTSHTGTSYPSDGNTSRTQTWLSGACQGNTRSYAPSADGNTMTFESKFQICPGISGGMWPGLFWLEGTDYQTAWKTDPNQASWNTTGKAEIDIGEFGSNGQTSPAVATTNFLQNISTGTGFIPDGSVATSGATDYSAAFHVFSVAWKGTSVQANRKVNWYVDAPYVSGTGPSGGTNTATLTNSAAIPVQSSCAFFLLLYLQIIAGSASSPQTCSIDYVRVYDQNIG